jgi:transcriptional regulator with XRE-family HTH domain
MTERTAFGLEMLRARERRGLTLEEISQQTKVSVAHFAGFEAGDLSRWPSGIFRRAFVRSYAGAVGLDPDAVLAQFSRIFPDPADGPRAVARIEAAARAEVSDSSDETPEAPAEAPVLRLALDHPGPGHGVRRLGAVWRRGLCGAIDVSLALAPAVVVAFVAGRGWFWVTAACVGFIGHVGFLGAVGTTPGSWLVARRRGRLPAVSVSAIPAARRRLDLDAGIGGRRYVPRHATIRPPAHPHRARH